MGAGGFGILVVILVLACWGTCPNLQRCRNVLCMSQKHGCQAWGHKMNDLRTNTSQGEGQWWCGKVNWGLSLGWPVWE